MQNSFEEKIVFIAKEKFGSQTKMAKALGLKPSTISDWVSGRIKPSFEVLKNLCIQAEISLDWLVLGKTFKTEILNIDLFNEVFTLAYNFAHDQGLLIDGAYFIACYDYINEELKKNKSSKKQENISSIFKRFQPIILKLRKK